MIDRFTAKARESINLAVQAAEELGHSYVGTEHLLIGLLEEGGGVAARVLSENGVKKEKVISQRQKSAGEQLQRGGAF